MKSQQSATGWSITILALACLLLGGGCRTSGRVDFSDPILNDRKILLFGPIDARTAELTIRELLYLDGKSHEPIDLLLQTPGGQVKSGMAIEQVMRLLQSPVNTWALSECNSGGAFQLAAGTGKRRAFRGAVMMVHGLQVHGPIPKDFVERLDKGYTEFWRERTRLPESWLPMPRGVEHHLSADEALAYGLVDEVVDR